MNPFIEFCVSGNPEYSAQSEKVEKIKLLAKQLKKPLMESLPTLKNKYIILPDGRRANTGDILRRPIIKNFSYGDCDHYCFVYGTSENKDSIIIEMNTDKNVTSNTIDKFLKHHSVNSVEIIKKKKGTKIKDIMSRAEKWAFEHYDLYSKNCQQFAFYSVFGKNYSPGIDKLNKATLPLINFSILCFEYNKANTTDKEYCDFFDGEIKKLTTLKNRITTNIENDVLVAIPITRIC